MTMMKSLNMWGIVNLTFTEALSEEKMDKVKER